MKILVFSIMTTHIYFKSTSTKYVQKKNHTLLLSIDVLKILKLTTRKTQNILSIVVINFKHLLLSRSNNLSEAGYDLLDLC